MNGSNDIVLSNLFGWFIFFDGILKLFVLNVIVIVDEKFNGDEVNKIVVVDVVFCGKVYEINVLMYG